MKVHPATYQALMRAKEIDRQLVKYHETKRTEEVIQQEKKRIQKLQETDLVKGKNVDVQV